MNQQETEEEITIPQSYYQKQNDIQRQLQSRYLSEQEKKNHGKLQKKVEKYYSKLGNNPNVTYKMIVENDNLTSEMQERSRQRQQRITELNRYLNQKITLNQGEGNPYYDNSFDKGVRLNTDNVDEGDSQEAYTHQTSSETVVPMIKTPSEGRYDRFEVLTTPPNMKTEYFEDFSQKRNLQQDSVMYTDRDRDYRQNIRDFGSDGELRQMNKERNRNEYVSFLEAQIKAKKLKEQKEKERLRIEEEYLDRKNKEWLAQQKKRLEMEEEARSSKYSQKSYQSEPSKDTLDLYVEKQMNIRKNSSSKLEEYSYNVQSRENSASAFKHTTKNILLKDMSRGNSGSQTPTLMQDEITEAQYGDGLYIPPPYYASNENVNIGNNENVQLMSDSKQIFIGDKQPQFEEPDLDEDERMAARAEGYKVLHSINKLAHERQKLQAEAMYFENEKQASLERFKKLNEEISRNRVQMGFDLNRHNLKHMSLKKKNKPGNVFSSASRMKKYDDLKLYMAQRSIFNS